MKRFLVWMGALIVLIGAGATGWTLWAPTQAAVEPRTVAVSRGDLDEKGVAARQSCPTFDCRGPTYAGVALSLGLGTPTFFGVA
jgi:hypothetical protein